MLRAKVVMPDKFWILESNGIRKGTMSKQPNPVKPDAVLVVIDQNESVYDNLDKACWELSINFEEAVEETIVEASHESVQGYPTKCPAFNPIWDIKRKLPVFTKTEKSRTLHAAGYYIIHFDTGWAQAFCPKVSTLEGNEFQGPFKDKVEMRERLRKANDID